MKRVTVKQRQREVVVWDVLIFKRRKTHEMTCYATFFQQISIPFFMKNLNLLTTSTRLGD